MPALAQDLFQNFVNEARGYVASMQQNKEEHDRSRLRLMLLLVEMERQNILWRHRYSNWEALLAAEKFCSKAIFWKFAAGHRTLGDLMVRRIGVAATISLMSVSCRVRDQVIEDFKKWLRQQPTAGPGEALMYIRKTSRVADTTKMTRTRLLAYVNILQAKLRAHGIRVPPAPNLS